MEGPGAVVLAPPVVDALVALIERLSLDLSPSVPVAEIARVVATSSARLLESGCPDVVAATEGTARARLQMAGAPPGRRPLPEAI